VLTVGINTIKVNQAVAVYNVCCRTFDGVYNDNYRTQLVLYCAYYIAHIYDFDRDLHTAVEGGESHGWTSV